MREFDSLRTAWSNYASQSKEFAIRQVGEVDKLLCKLERHASPEFNAANLAIAVRLFMIGVRAVSIGHQRR